MAAIAGAVLIFRDVGDRRRSERERAELLAKRAGGTAGCCRRRRISCKLALEAGRMGTWEWTIGSGLVKWSHGLESIHGLAPGTFPGTFEAVQREVHPADRERVAESIARSRSPGGLPYHVEYRIVRTDGAVRWVEGVGQVFRDADGRPSTYGRRALGRHRTQAERRSPQGKRAALPLAGRQRAGADLGSTAPPGCEDATLGLPRLPRRAD